MNIQNFGNGTIFQNGITSFIVHLKATHQDFDMLAKLFDQLDASGDGYITKDEL